MALNKTSKFGVDEGLFKKDIQEVYSIQQVQKVHEVQKEIGTTQGRKGQKLKRINMAFSDVNYEYIKTESKRRGISATAFVNQINDKFRNR